MPKPAQEITSPSFQAQVNALAIGESISRVRAVDPKMRISQIAEELPALRQQLRNAVTPAVTRAKGAVGGSYSIEVADMPTPSGNYYVVAVVTRND
jgi:hypothetical protein